MASYQRGIQSPTRIARQGLHIRDPDLDPIPVIATSEARRALAISSILYCDWTLFRSVFATSLKLDAVWGEARRAEDVVEYYRTPVLQ
jgi:hypothetical protein